MGGSVGAVSRVPLIGPGAEDPVVAEVFRRFADEGREPIALYRALAHAPELLRAYSGLATALRYEAQTPRRLRELAILRIAQLTGSRYEWSHHVPMAGAAGVAEEQIAALAEWSGSEAFDARERALLRCADELHECQLSDDAFAELESCFSESELVELLLLLAFYEAVARVIAGLGIEVEPEYESHP
jgi:alkylhydroperoxidase family enzyme